MAETVKTATKTRKAPAKKATNGANGSVELIQKRNPARPSHDQIAELARKYWAERGYKDGHHEEDWFRAEQELRARAS